MDDRAGLSQMSRLCSAEQVCAYGFSGCQGGRLENSQNARRQVARWCYNPEDRHRGDGLCAEATSGLASSGLGPACRCHPAQKRVDMRHVGQAKALRRAVETAPRHKRSRLGVRRRSTLLDMTMPLVLDLQAACRTGRARPDRLGHTGWRNMETMPRDGIRMSPEQPAAKPPIDRV